MKNYLIAILLKIASVFYRLVPKKKKYDYAIYMRGHLGDYLLIHDLLGRLCENKKVLFVTDTSYQNALPELYEKFAGVALVRTIKEVIRAAFGKRADTLLVLDAWDRRFDYLFSVLFCAKRKIVSNFDFGDAKTSRIFMSLGAFDEIIQSDDGNTHLTAFYTKALNQAFHTDFPCRMVDLRGTFGGQKLVEKPYFILNTSVAGLTEKAWPVERFADLIDHCAEKTGLPCVMVGPESSRPDVALLTEKCKKCRIISTVGQTTLRDLFDLVADASFVVGNDTGTSHMAAACRVPGFSILSEMYGSMFLPYPPGMCDDVTVAYVNKSYPCRHCVRKAAVCEECAARHNGAPCVTEISVGDAIAALDASGILTSRTEATTR